MAAIFASAFSTTSLEKNLPPSMTRGASRDSCADAGMSRPAQPTTRAGSTSQRSDRCMVACLLNMVGAPDSLGVGLQGRLDRVQAVEQAGVEVFFLELHDDLVDDGLAVRGCELLLLR